MAMVPKLNYYYCITTIIAAVCIRSSTRTQ